jgi:hypothetical protein
MTILEARGLFWWGDDPIPANQFAPNSSVSGLLKIDEDGRISLELDGCLPSVHGRWSAIVRSELPSDKCIRGLLKGSSQQALLVGLFDDGGQMRSSGISYERYVASTCFVSESGPCPSKLSFKHLIIPLSGFEEWLRLGAIKVVQTPRTISVKYKRPKKATYRSADGSLAIDFEIDDHSSSAVFSGDVSMKETALASLRFTKPLDLDGIRTQYQLFEDLLILLTGTDCVLNWAWLDNNKTSRCRLYFRRMGNRAAGIAPRYFECVTNFIQLRDEFGSIWEAFKNKREELGPGLYLYLGTRRSMQLYVEHRFVNLVWGIEAFHRRKYTASPTPPLKKKVERILALIADKKDHKWLSYKLADAHEPSLGERICETISSLPFGFDVTRLRAFSDACAKRRNDISHFGGQRHKGGSYQQFLTELHDSGEVLATLYQMLLLQEIGVNEKILKQWVFEGFGSYSIKVHLVKTGLLDKSTLDPKSDTAALVNQNNILKQ